MKERGKPGEPGQPGEEAHGRVGGKGGEGGAGGKGGTGDPQGRGGEGGLGGAGGVGAQGIPGPPGPPGHTPIHKWRWIGLTVWIVLFTGLVAYALHEQRDYSRDNAARFCNISRTFIASNVVLRNALNEAGVQGIGQRQALIQNDQELLRLFRASKQTPLIKAIIRYFQTEVALSHYQNTNAREQLNAADTAVARWMQLKRDLRC